MIDENKKEETRVQADNNSIAIGNISAGGNIGSVNIHTGYTSEQVSVLIAKIQSTFQPKPFDGRCPYKGLDVFEEEDAELFFGREKLVDDLVNRVKDSRTVFVTGPSGSGKSSLVRAGLIHALKQGGIKGSDRWLFATMKPGRDPIGELGRVVSSLASSTNPEDEIRAKAMKDATIFARWCEITLKEGRDKRLVLFIDQFEEVFTQISNEEERVAFLNLLTHAAITESGRVIILFSMRSDFVSNCATYPQLNALLNQQFVQIGAMQPEELVSAIAQPALRVGLRIDPDLIAQIINEMKGEPGALPLMQFALKDLFDSQQEKSGVIALTLNDYLQRGGIHKALERHADDAFTKLSKNEQELARSIFSGLIEIGRGTQDTKRTALFAELVPSNTKAADVEAIVQKLADARLITTDEQAGKETVTLAHEKLINAWPWLKKLVNENRDVIALQNQITADAKEWDEHKRDAGYLYAGGRLINAREQLNANKLILSGVSNEFVETGFSKQKREQRIKILSISTMISLIVAGIMLFSYISTSNSNRLAEQNKNSANTQAALASTAQANAEEAQKQATIARVGELVANAKEIRDKNLRTSLLLGVEASQLLDNVQSRANLLETINSKIQFFQIIPGLMTDDLTSATFSPDNNILAIGGYGGVTLWDVAARHPIGQPILEKQWVYSIAFSPDSKILAIGSDNGVTLWDVATHQPIGQPLVGISDGPLNSYISSIAFSPNGKTVAFGLTSFGDLVTTVWNIDADQPASQTFKGKRLSESYGIEDHILSVAFSSDGKILASGSEFGTLNLWDVASHKPIGLPLEGYLVAFSPDGQLMASASDSDTIAIRDLSEQTLPNHSENLFLKNLGRNYLTSIAFSPDSKILAASTGDSDGSIILWNITNSYLQNPQSIGVPLTGYMSDVRNIAFSPDGKMLASVGDGFTILWNITTHQLLEGYQSESTSVFSPDGQILASGRDDGTVNLWDVISHQPIGQPLGNPSTQAGYGISSLAFSLDGKSLASGSNDGTIQLWDVASHQPIGQPLINQANVIINSVAFSPNGELLASGNGDGTITFWGLDLQKSIGQPLPQLMAETQIQNVAFSPDGSMLAASDNKGTIVLWDVVAHQPIGQPLVGQQYWIEHISFSPNGKILASSSNDGTIFLWDIASHKLIDQFLTTSNRSPDNSATSLAFSLDGQILVSGNYDGTITLWDVSAHRVIGQPLVNNEDNPINNIAFSIDSKKLILHGHDGSITQWDIDIPQSWTIQSCQLARRNFTRAEWKKYFPNEEYRATCPQWPLEPEAIPTPTP